MSDWISDVGSSDMPRAASDTARGPGFPRSRENGDASAASRSAFLARSLGRPFGAGFRLALGGAFGLVVAFARLERGRRDDGGDGEIAVVDHRRRALRQRDLADRKSTRLNSSHSCAYRMPSSA